MSRLAGSIPDDVVADVKRAANIVDVVSRYLELKPAGRSFKALCPFHDDKHPSLSVNPELQIFKCWSCGKAGDVFTFVAEHERVAFPEAVRIVASIVGITIRETAGSAKPRADKQQKARLYDLHTWAAKFFARTLAEDPAAEHARRYLAGRHFDKPFLQAWQIGFAPASWDALGNAARQAGYSDRELLAAGLVRPGKNDRRPYDWFRKRVVFPIHDRQGRVIAFGARALDPDDDIKYINSPDTELFHKSRCLYGLHRARDAIIQRREVVITEGYTDTLMCHQQEIGWAVATLGTALTSHHASLLRRLARRVVLVFDADQAGERAVDHSLPVFADADLDVRVATLADGTDPCDFLVERGAEPFLEHLEAARNLYRTKLDFVRRTHDVATAVGRARALDEALESVVLVSNVAKADHLAQQAARQLGVELDAARRRLKQLAARRRSSAPRAEAAGQAPVPLDPIEAGILSALLAANQLVPCVLARVCFDDFEDTRVRRILRACVDLYDREGAIDPSELSARLQDADLAAIVADIATAPLQTGNWDQWLQDCLDRLDERKQRPRARQLRDQATQGASEQDRRQALAALFEQHRRRAGGTGNAAPDAS